MSKNFYDSFHEAVKRHSDKPALIFENQKMTYRELDQKTDVVAKALREQGVTEGDVLPILLNRSLDSVVAMIGILKSGAGFCNIDLEYPKERIDFICGELDPKIQVDSAFMDTLHQEIQPQDISTTDVLSDKNFTQEHQPLATAVVVYTSGSTGHPKGVILPKQAMNLSLEGGLCGMGSDETFLLVASLSFIGGIVYVLSPLATGLTLHLANDSLRKDGQQILDYLRKNKITMAFFPPQLARFILENGDGLLTALLTGSEKVVDLYSEKTRIFNLYGASETFGPMVSFEIDRPYMDGTPIGKAFPIGVPSM